MYSKKEIEMIRIVIDKYEVSLNVQYVYSVAGMNWLRAAVCCS